MTAQNLPGIYQRHFSDPRRERAFLSAVGFTTAFATEPHPRWSSRISAAAYGVASALTLDEFALWLDLHDDYWDKKGRNSIDAVALFGGLLTIGAAGRGALAELGLLPRFARRMMEHRQAGESRAR